MGCQPPGFKAGRTFQGIHSVKESTVYKKEAETLGSKTWHIFACQIIKLAYLQVKYANKFDSLTK